jgi:hypothetical protein
MVSAQLHFIICTEIWIKLQNEHWYNHVPKLLETSHEGKVTTLWNQQAQSNRTIPNNNSDTINRDKEK